MNRSIDKRIAAYVAARGMMTAQVAVVAERSATQRGYNSEIDGLQITLAERRKLRTENLAQKLIDGADDALPDPEEEAEDRKLEARITVLTAAVAKMGNQIAGAEAGVAPLMPAVTEAALHLVSEVQGNGLDQLKAVIAQLVPPVVQLLAGDHIRAATLGTNGFQVPNGAPVPSNGALLLAGLLKAIPKNLRPDEMDDERLAEAARAISQPIIAKLKG